MKFILIEKKTLLFIYLLVYFEILCLQGMENVLKVGTHCCFQSPCCDTGQKWENKSKTENKKEKRRVFGGQFGLLVSGTNYINFFGFFQVRISSWSNFWIVVFVGGGGRSVCLATKLWWPGKRRNQIGPSYHHGCFFTLTLARKICWVSIFQIFWAFSLDRPSV